MEITDYLIFDFEDEQLKIDIYDIINDLDITLKKVEKTIDDLYKLKKIISIYFVNQKTITELNFKYRGINNPTDVLSFSYNYSQDYLGEIVVYFDKIRQRAKLEEEDVRTTLVYMVFHSILHLLGYTHEVEEDYKQIEEKTEELMRRFSSL